jgi:hypothetical protein
MDKLEKRLGMVDDSAEISEPFLHVTQDLHKLKRLAAIHRKPWGELVGGARFELATNGLKVRCSTD